MAQNQHLPASQTSSGSPDSGDRFTAAARKRWQELGAELRSDVARFNPRHSRASFNATGEAQYRADNPESGLELTLTADFENHIIRYVYALVGKSAAGAPEGGMLSMRESPSGTVEFYSADEQLTPEETRRVLLEPIFPPPAAK